MVKQSTQKASPWFRLLLLLVAVVVVNILCGTYFFRIDLTKEKRYTLSDASENMSATLDDVLFVKVYLDGELPARYKRLRNAVRELLDEYRIASGGKVEYEFIDPFAGKDNKQINDLIEQMRAQGLNITTAQDNKDDQLSQKIIAPAAMCYYKGKEYPVNFLKGQFEAGEEDKVRNEEVINQSVELLEYKFSNIVRKCTLKKKKKIAFLIGSGELAGREVADFARELSEFYELARLDIHKNPSEKFAEYDGLVIAKPDSTFSEYDKFKIDQYVMHGGKVIWLIDALFANMDSTRNEAGEFMTYDYNLNLDDILFKYGARINPVLVQDLQHSFIPIMEGYQGDQQKPVLKPWVFYPLLGSSNNHPIVKNLGVVQGHFVNTIDTVGNSRIKKTVLLHTSDRTRTVGNPVRVNINISRVKPNPLAFGKRRLPVAVLLEGNFESVFRYRYRKNNDSTLEKLDFRDHIENNKMIVIADGDLVRNRVTREGEVYPLGFDRYTNQVYDNKNFLVNCVDYLCDGSGIIDVRMKEVKLRLLDADLLKEEKTKWQLINMGLPVVLIVLFGLGNAWLRKRKYTR